MLFTVAYQTKWEHHNNFDDAVALLQVEADCAGLVEWKFGKIWRATFGKTCDYLVVAIGPPPDCKDNNIIADCFYLKNANMNALQANTKKFLEEAIRDKSLNWVVQGCDWNLELTTPGNTNIIAMHPRFEAYPNFCLMHMTDDPENDGKELVKPEDQPFVWSCSPRKDAMAWVTRLLSYREQIDKALATPATQPATAQ